MDPSRRMAALERKIKKLDSQLSRLNAIDRRFAWYRLTVFVMGGIGTWLAATQIGTLAGWISFVISLVVFFLVVFLHRRLDAGIRRFLIWKVINASNLARLKLDWENIGEPYINHLKERKSLDIDLDLTGPRSIHHLLNSAVSLQGSMRLADWLTNGEPNIEEIQARQEIVKELAAMPRFRDRLLLTFLQASKEQLDGRQLLTWIHADYPAVHLRWSLPLATLLTLTNILLFMGSSLAHWPAYWVISMSIHLAIYYFNAGTLNLFLEAIVRLDTELIKFRSLLQYLESFPYRENHNLARLCSPFIADRDKPSSRLRKIKLTTAAVGLRMNPIMGLVLNIFLPWDFYFAFRAARQRIELAQILPTWLETWTQLESLIGLGNFAYLHPEHAFPKISFQAAPALGAIGLAHPLLPPENKISNDFTLQSGGKLAIITGSNMAGKSTFIKAVGANLCLAYAGAPVDADSFITRPFRLHTCIRISDSIADGFSYFYAEVKCLKGLLEKLREDRKLPVLYLIDEIFRGTNNRERLIGSRAYVGELVGRHGIGLLATHDLELTSLAGVSAEVHNFHFRDSVQDGRLVFDYKIHPGPCPTTNALRIMEMEGLPIDSVWQAEKGFL